jgi:hypothetical protein
MPLKLNNCINITPSQFFYLIYIRNARGEIFALKKYDVREMKVAY